jgi:DivIVA domain-containing protein
MTPEEIKQREFFVGLRGYDRDEVQEFLIKVAEEHQAVLAELDELRSRPEPTLELDPFEELGAQVTSVLRSANQSAENIAAEAQAEAARLRDEARAEAGHLRSEAEAYAERVHRDANDEATRLRDEAERIVADAREDAARIEAEAEQRGLERAAAAANEAVARLADANRRHEELRARLAETSDEIQLALLALGEAPAPAGETIRQIVLGDEPVVLDERPAPESELSSQEA